MEFGLSQEQILLQDTMNRFLDTAVSLEHLRAFAEQPDSHDIWSGLAEIGVTSLLVPEAAGGVGLSVFDAALVAETLGSHCAPGPFLGSAMLAPLALRRTGNDDHPLLADLAVGSTTVGLAVNEVAGARADAGITGDGKTLHGKALYVHDFNAQHFLVADTDQRLYLVAAAAPGVTGQVLSTIDKSRVSGALSFRNSPAQCLTDDPAVLHSLIDIGRVGFAADTLGAAQYMLNQAVVYAQQRKQFGRAIASFQAVKHMCAEMAAELEPCRAMVWYAAHAADQEPSELRVVACQTKAHISEVAKFVAKTATEIHGGMGFTDLLGLHYWFKRIGYNRQMLGAPEFVREQAAVAQGL